jgi:sugar lactone lactonase YvrE
VIQPSHDGRIDRDVAARRELLVVAVTMRILRRARLLLCAATLLAAPEPARSASVSVVLGPEGDGAGTGFGIPGGLAVDGSGNLFVASGSPSPAVFRVTPEGEVRVVIDADGDGTNPLSAPTDLALDAAGNLFVAGRQSDNVFRVTAGGEIAQLIDATGDGAGHPLGELLAMAVDAAGNVFVAGRSDNVFRVTPAGAVSVVMEASGDGRGNPLRFPAHLALAASGDLFVAGAFSDNVFRVSPSGAVALVIDARADGGDVPLELSGSGASPLAVDPDGNLFVASRPSRAPGAVFRVTPGGAISRVLDASGDGSGRRLGVPGAMAVDAGGTLYVTSRLFSDAESNLFRVSPAGPVRAILDVLGDRMGNRYDDPFFGLVVDPSGEAFAANAGQVQPDLFGTQFLPGVFRVARSGDVGRVLGPDGDGTTFFGSSAFLALAPERVLYSAIRGAVFRVDLSPECGDGLDNDGDGNVDFPADRSCRSAEGASEQTATLPLDALLVTTLGGLLRVDPGTGEREVVAEDLPLSSLALEPSGDVVLLERAFGSPGGAVVRLDLNTLERTVVSSGGELGTPLDLAVDAQGQIVVADFGSARPGATGAIVVVDPVTGEQTAIARDVDFHPTAVTIGRDGEIFALEGDPFVGTPRIVRVDRATGERTLVAVLEDLRFAWLLATDADGDLLVTLEGPLVDPDEDTGELAGQVRRVDPESGDVSLFSFSAETRPFGIAVDSRGRIYVAEEVFRDGMLRIDRATGVQTTVLRGLEFPWDLVAVPNHGLEIAVRGAAAESPVNPFARGVLPVTLLGGEAVDVGSVDPTTLRLGPAGATPSGRVRLHDVDRDGLLDLRLRFPVAGSGIALGDRELCVSGETFATSALLGCAPIRTVGPLPARRRPR